MSELTQALEASPRPIVPDLGIGSRLTGHRGPAPLGVVRVSRGKDSCGALRSVAVYLDDEQVGAVGWNQTEEFRALPGPHAIYVKMDWCRSVPLRIELDAEKPVELTIIAPNPLFAGFEIIFGWKTFFKLVPRGV